MNEIRSTIVAKELQNTMFASLQDDIKALEVKFQNQLNPQEKMPQEVTAHFKGKTSLGHNYEPHREENIYCNKGQPFF